MYTKVRKSDILELNKVLDEAHHALKELMAKVDRLEAENASLKEERDFLKKMCDNLSKVPNLPIAPLHGNLFNQDPWPSTDKYID